MHADPPSGMIELSELSGGKGDYFRHIASESAAWDGADLVRRIGTQAR